MTITTARPPLSQEHYDDPQAFSTYVTDVITNVDGVTLIGLFFDVGAERAYAVVEGLDDYLDVKAVSRILGAEGFLKMVRAPEASDLAGREDRYRGGSAS